MTRMTTPDCAVMCNLINTHTHKHTHTHTHTHKHTHTHTHTSPLAWEDQCEWHRITRMTGPDCAVMCNLINTHTHTHCNLINTHTHTHTHDQCEWHRMTRMTGPDCVVMCNLINTHTHTQVRIVQVERVCPLYISLSRLTRGFRNKYH